MLYSAVAAKINREGGKDAEKQDEKKANKGKEEEREEAERGTLTYIYRNGGLKSFNWANTVEMMDCG